MREDQRIHRPENRQKHQLCSHEGSGVAGQINQQITADTEERDIEHWLAIFAQPVGDDAHQHAGADIDDSGKQHQQRIDAVAQPDFANADDRLIGGGRRIRKPEEQDGERPDADRRIVDDDGKSRRHGDSPEMIRHRRIAG
ncbi:hypothetical protein D3C86_1689140 [compost metagenome]